MRRSPGNGLRTVTDLNVYIMYIICIYGRNDTVRLFADETFLYGTISCDKMQLIFRVIYIDYKPGNKSGRLNIILQSVSSFTLQPRQIYQSENTYSVEKPRHRSHLILSK